jgi:hypothetical protein
MVRQAISFPATPGFQRSTPVEIYGDIDVPILDRALKVGVSKQQLDSPQISGFAVNEGACTG